MKDLDRDAKDMMDSLASIDRVKYEEWKHEPLDPNDPRVIELGRRMIQACKQQTQNDRDHYRELLEARVSGLEALLTAIVRQVPGEAREHNEHLNANCIKALNYLAGHGRL